MKLMWKSWYPVMMVKEVATAFSWRAM